jgi:hypothetical protein
MSPAQKTESVGEKSKKEGPDEKPQLTGKGFFWHFPKKKKEDTTPPDVPKTGPEVEGNRLNLKN